MWPARFLVVALTGLSLFLGFYDLTKRSIWLDEGFSWLFADQRLSVVFDIARSENWHLLPYLLLLHATISVFGDSPSALRAPSVVAGAACVPILYALCVRLRGRSAGVVACVLFVVSEPLVFWQQNARDYTLVVLLALGSTLAAVVAIRAGKVWPLPIWALLLGIGCYTHPEMLFLVPVHLAVILLWGPSNRVRVATLVTTAIAGLCTLPILGEAVHSSVYQTSFLLPPNHDSATEIASFLASAASSVGPVTAVNHALLGITFAIALIGVAQLGADITERGCRPENLGLGLGLAWLLIPAVIDWLVSETGRQAFSDRYLILSLPAAALVLALVLDTVRPRALGLYAAAYLIIFHAGLLIQTYPYQLDDYRDSTKFVLSEARPGDCVTFEINDGRALYDYYVSQFTAGDNRRYVVPVQVLPLDVVTSSTLVDFLYEALGNQQIYDSQTPAKVAAIAPYCKRVFVVESHTGGSTDSASYDLLQHLRGSLEQYYSRAGTKVFPSVDIQIFDRARK